MAEQDELFVEVVYATPAKQTIVRVRWEPGLTAGQAVERSGLAHAFTEIASRPLVLGVFGARVAFEERLEPGDRVEICRPLLADPRELRRELARRGAVMGKNAGDPPGAKKAD